MNKYFNTILTTTFIAGVIDFAAACVQAYVSNGLTPAIVLKYIASGLLGKAAFSGGLPVMFLGLLAHFMVVFACVWCFFYCYPKIIFLTKSIIINALLIGLVAWLVTNVIVIPLSQIKPAPFNLPNALISISILVICIGLPTAFAAKRCFLKD